VVQAAPQSEPIVPQTEELVINMGPQHPSTHGVLRVILQLDGEIVRHTECDIGYLHRGVEKIGENLNYAQFVPYTDRTDYVAAPANNLGYVEAAEKLLELDVPIRAHYIRVITAELARISSHLLWLGTHALDIGAMTVFLYCFRDREKILGLFEVAYGARLTVHSFRVGGVYEDPAQQFFLDCERFVREFPRAMYDYEDLLTENRIWKSRTRGVATLSAGDAIDLGASGPILRASGVAFDVRKTEPYAAYDDFDFTVPVGKNGDIYDRYLVRLEEMRQSCYIIEQAVADLPTGKTMAKVPRTMKPKEGDVYHRIEGPKGELGYYLVSDGTDRPFRLRIRPPSFINLQTLPLLLQDQLVADAVAAIGSIDIVLGEVDR
jgi:NADH-quinone oxidoreductase subunit D